MEVEGVGDENQVPLEASTIDRRNQGGEGEHEWDISLRILREAQRKASEVLGKSRISNQAKTEVEGIWTRVIEEVGELWGKSQGGKSLPLLLEKEIAATLSQRGIECADDWREYLRTMEQDGETMADICDMLRTDVVHVKGEIAALQRQWRSKEELMRAENTLGQPSAVGQRNGVWILSLEKMARLLSQKSTAGRLRALTELRSLKMGPDQEVAEFCILLEKLGKQANPDCTIEDRSLEYAQILLDNLSDWPEHFQLVGALHRVDPRRAYEEIKQLALSIEQSKIMFGGGRRTGVSHWKSRAAQYRDHGGIGKSQRAKYSNNELDYLEGESPQIRENYWQSDYQAGTSSSAELHMQDKAKCSKFGHIAKDCPQLSARVNQLKGEMTVSEIIRQARNLEMTVKKECGNRDLVGGRIVKQLRLLGGNNPALLDTGSMVSVIPVEILAKARDRGFDVDALKLVEKSQLAPVLDASNKKMDFLGAVYVEAKLEGGNRASVPFYISPSKNDEIILGTNALNKLGVRVSIVGEKEEDGRGHPGRTKEKRTTVGRIYVPQRMIGRVPKQYSVDIPVKVDRVLRASKRVFAHGVHGAQQEKVVKPFPEETANAGRRRARKGEQSKPKVGKGHREAVRESASESCRTHPRMDADRKQFKERRRIATGSNCHGQASSGR
ncbi:hypothetical protein OSTOST_07384 [Ostertagia ostertagi]